MEKELTYWMALAHLERMYTRRKNEIIVECFNKDKSLADFFLCDERTWTNDYAIKDEEIPLLCEAKAQLPNYAFQVEDMLEQGYDIIPITSPEYPRALKINLKYNAPMLLYVKGNKELLNNKSVAVVGSRNAKPVSMEFTDSIVRKAAGEDYVVVSGYAKGVDRQALDSALSYQGKSVIVLPQGITTFSTGFKQLHKSISTGCVTVISAFAPKAPWSVAFAMARNPIIYAMAEQIFVAESDSKGGTFSGVTDGLRKGRTIYVRMPEPSEKNANLQLVGMGATAVDMQGNVVKTDNDIDSRKKKIAELLKGKKFTAKEIALRILDREDNKSQAEMRKLLAGMSDVVQVPKSRPIRYTIQDVRESLF